MPLLFGGIAVAVYAVMLQFLSWLMCL